MGWVRWEGVGEGSRDRIVSTTRSTKVEREFVCRRRGDGRLRMRVGDESRTPWGDNDASSEGDVTGIGKPKSLKKQSGDI